MKNDDYKTYRALCNSHKERFPDTPILALMPTKNGRKGLFCYAGDRQAVKFMGYEEPYDPDEVQEEIVFDSLRYFDKVGCDPYEHIAGSPFGIQNEPLFALRALVLHYDLSLLAANTIFKSLFGKTAIVDCRVLKSAIWSPFGERLFKEPIPRDYQEPETDLRKTTDFADENQNEEEQS